MSSQFCRKYVKIDRNTWCSYLERGSVNSSVATVFFVHGFSGSAVDFVKVALLLEPSYHLVAIDYLNHGYSSVYDRKIELRELVEFVKKVNFLYFFARLHILVKYFCE